MNTYAFILNFSFYSASCDTDNEMILLAAKIEIIPKRDRVIPANIFPLSIVLAPPMVSAIPAIISVLMIFSLLVCGIKTLLYKERSSVAPHHPDKFAKMMNRKTSHCGGHSRFFAALFCAASSADEKLYMILP